MEYLFCPLKIEYGDVATWVAGIGTVAATAAAVWLGLRESRRQNDIRKGEARALAATILSELRDALYATAVIRNCLAGLPTDSFSYDDWNQMLRPLLSLPLPLTESSVPRFGV